ncbi:MAG: thioesterase family protein [Ignavibacteriaceae bacterium]
MELKNFKHKISVTVRFNEVDMLGVCNNAVYVNYLEHARLQYIKQLGLIPEKGIFSDGKLFFVVKNELNYKTFAHFDDELDVYSKVSFIKNTSFGFEHLIVNSKTDEIILEGNGVIVYVDAATNKSTDLPENFYEKVSHFENEVKILKEKK